MNTRFKNINSRFTRYLLGTLTILALINAGCRQSESLSNDKGFIANNTSSNNYLLAFLGDSTGIPGTLQDIPSISRVFNEAGGLNFTMPGPFSGGWQHPSNSQIIDEVSKAAKAMLVKDLEAWKNLQRGGTMFIYFSSHGLQDGSTSTGGGSSSIHFAEIAKAIRSARGGQPLERVIVMFDTCFSGQNVTGSKAINQNTGILLTAEQEKQALDDYVAKAIKEANEVTGFYKSAIFIASSLPTETSGDEANGGTGTQAFLRAIAAARNGTITASTGTTGAGGNVLNNLLAALSNGSTVNQNDPANTNSTTNTTTTGATTPAVSQGSGLGGAGTGKGPSTTTIRTVLQNFVTNAGGFQTPVWCVEPKELADDFFFDPPEGYLPANPVNAARTGNGNRACSR